MMLKRPFIIVRLLKWLKPFIPVSFTYKFYLYPNFFTLFYLNRHIFQNIPEYYLYVQIEIEQ